MSLRRATLCKMSDSESEGILFGDIVWEQYMSQNPEYYEFVKNWDKRKAGTVVNISIFFYQCNVLRFR